MKDNVNFHVFNAVQYEPPVIVENNKDEWVEYGEDNNYYQFLIDRYTKSPTNNAVINNIVKLIFGRGLCATDASKKPNEYAQMVTLFHDDCVKQLISDLKMLGQCAIQVIYSEDKTRIVEAYHVPVQLLRAEKCNEDGEIEAYYFSNDWTDVKKNPPERIPAFGINDNVETSIMFVRPYAVGMKYYSYVDYQGSLPYSTLEEEIGNYLINEVQNGFSGTKVVNFNNGIPDDERREEISRDVIAKLTGTKGKRTIVAFNHSEQNRTTVDDIPLNDAPNHYEYLADECMRKIMLGHNVTSPLLFGIQTNTGFSSNADELKNSFILYYNMVIRPYQECILKALETILAVNDVALNLYFETLKPLEFTDPNGKQPVEEEDTKSRYSEDNPCWDGYEMVGFKIKDGKKVPNCVPVKASKDCGCKEELEAHEEEYHVDFTKYGSKADRRWILIDEFDVNPDDEEKIDLELSKAQINASEDIARSPSFVEKLKKIALISTGKATPDEVSIDDWIINGFYFITRYRYEGEVSANTRPFCRAMRKADLLYRKEDIEQMSKDSVNPGWGPNGANNYDILRWKGGGNCHHLWRRQTYVGLDMGVPIDPFSDEARQISTYRARKYGYRIRNPFETAARPIDLPNRGFLPK